MSFIGQITINANIGIINKNHRQHQAFFHLIWMFQSQIHDALCVIIHVLHSYMPVCQSEPTELFTSIDTCAQVVCDTQRDMHVSNWIVNETENSHITNHLTADWLVQYILYIYRGSKVITYQKRRFIWTSRPNSFRNHSSRHVRLKDRSVSVPHACRSSARACNCTIYANRSVSRAREQNFNDQ